MLLDDFWQFRAQKPRTEKKFHSYKKLLVQVFVRVSMFHLVGYFYENIFFLQVKYEFKPAYV